MSLTLETLALPAAGPGTHRHLRVLRFRGPAPGPKAYIQAAVHADEVPALLVAQHLRERLTALDAVGQLRGEILLVPFANPIGLSQFVQARHMGRFELDSGQNFNRGYPDLFEAVAADLAVPLGGDADANVRAIRAAMGRQLEAMCPVGENEALKLMLYRLSHDADVVLDLHCDDEALMHLYLGTPLWPQAADLAACPDSRATLLADDSGGDAFDEANSRLWWQLAARFPHAVVPPACLAATVELRGERDVDDRLAARYAEGLLAFLAGRGFIAGSFDAPRASAPEATLLEAVDTLTASQHGVLIWQCQLGDSVRCGDLLGQLLDPETGVRQPLLARNDGLLFARRAHRWVRPGQWLAKIAGREALAWRKAGALLPN